MPNEFHLPDKKEKNEEKLRSNISFFCTFLDEGSLKVLEATAKALAHQSESYLIWWRKANHQD